MPRELVLMKDYSYLPDILVQAVRRDVDESNAYQIIEKFGLEPYLDAKRFVHNTYCKCSRIKKRIEYMLNQYGEIYFCTFTIDDNHLGFDQSVYMNTIKKAYSALDGAIWLFNNDYGEKNDRLHYHGVVGSLSIDSCEYLKSLLLLHWHYGFVDVRSIIDSVFSSVRTARYIVKLSRHAIKDRVLIVRYSRLSKLNNDR